MRVFAQSKFNYLCTINKTRAYIIEYTHVFPILFSASADRIPLAIAAAVPVPECAGLSGR